jgi:undecaprenyl pyrophosphate phosphatase UppP
VCPENKYEKLDVKKVMCLGMLQACALAPGISRLALTFVGARWLRIPARRAFEISFLIQWPLILCASLYGVYVLRSDARELLNPILMWVMLGSSGIAYAGLYMQQIMIQKNSLWRWGIYMLVPFIISIVVGVCNA